MSRQHENDRSDELAPAEQAAIERALAAVTPAPPRIDRDRLMFLAGAASAIGGASATASGGRQPPGDFATPIDGDAERRDTTGKLTLPARLIWPASTAALAATSLALAIALLVRPAPQVQVVYHHRPVTAPAVAPQSPLSVQPPAPSLVAAAASRTPPSEFSSHNYLRTRDVALRLGLDALGTFPSAGGDDSPVPTYRSLLESLSPVRSRAANSLPESSQM
jgi:hypothetical protein